MILPHLFSFKNGKTCYPGILQHSVKFYKTFRPNLVFLTCPSPDIGQNSNVVISDFRISGQSSVQWNLPVADTPNSGHAMNSGQNVESQMWQSFLNYLPIVAISQYTSLSLKKTLHVWLSQAKVLLLWCAILISRHNIMARDWREIEYIGKKSNRVRNNDIELRKKFSMFPHL